MAPYDRHQYLSIIHKCVAYIYDISLAMRFQTQGYKIRKNFTEMNVIDRLTKQNDKKHYKK